MLSVLRSAFRLGLAAAATLGATLLFVGNTMVGATGMESITVPPGFAIELLYAVPKDSQGSWVSLANEKPGRLIASDQSGKLYRITLGTKPVVEPVDLDIGGAQGLLYAFDSLYVVVNQHEGKPSGLYRVRDTNGDDKYDSVQLLRAIEGGGEHGPHAVILTPDGKSLLVVSGNHTKLTPINRAYLPTGWKEDQLLPRLWDAGGHAVGVLAPGGWICRTDKDGKEWTLVSSGYRNAYDIALNPEGEMFTYDSDMEWDIGSPWYRPTRVCHAVEGSEFGWRSGTGKWPACYPDSLPPVADVGPGSPTGVVFGTGAKFPAKFQNALFICDWSYGNIYSVELIPDGSSYKGVVEKFATGNPFPVTDAVIGADGAMYVTTGGRNTASSLFRITYTGKESTKPVVRTPDAGAEARAIRHELAAMCLPGADGPTAVEKAWKHLANPDRFLRYTARLVLEQQAQALWKDRAAAEQNPQAKLTLALALARTSSCEEQKNTANLVLGLSWDELTREQRLELLRVYGVLFARGGMPSPDVQARVVNQVDAHFPSSDLEMDRELCRLLVYLRAPKIVERSLMAMSEKVTQEQQIHYALCLSSLRYGWTKESRTRYFAWFHEAMRLRGGHSFSGFLRNIRLEAIASLTDAEAVELADWINKEPSESLAPVAPPRPKVKDYTLDELVDAVAKNGHKPNVERGRQVFSEASCFKCHRFLGEGGITGPDLTAVAKRFTPKEMLESIVLPSKTVSDQYQASDFVLKDGQIVRGKVINLSGDSVSVLTDMFNPDSLTNIQVGNIESQLPSKLSLMPEALLNTFTVEEILDLLAYLRSGGEAAKLSMKP